jgi:hypothetical protein
MTALEERRKENLAKRGEIPPASGASSSGRGGAVAPPVASSSSSDSSGGIVAPPAAPSSAAASSGGEVLCEVLNQGNVPFFFTCPAIEGVERLTKEERAEAFHKNASVESECKRILRLINKALVHRDRWKAHGKAGEDYRRKAADEGRCYVLEVPNAWVPVGLDDEPPGWAERLASLNPTEQRITRAAELLDPPLAHRQ